MHFGDSLSDRRWLPALVWSGIILLSTSIPNPPVPHMFAHADKVTHFALYAVLGFLMARALRSEKRRSLAIVVTVALGVAFGAADEWHQRFIAGRSSEVADWGADSTGVLFGALLCAMLSSRHRGLATHT